jgi:hypothetical protein
MKTKKITLALLALGAWLSGGAVAHAANPEPAWKLTLNSLPANFAPGATGSFLAGPMYHLVATNVGAAPTSGQITIEDTLPAGLTPINLGKSCAAVGQTVTCTGTEVVGPGQSLQLEIIVKVDPLAAEGTVTDQASVEGGGALPTIATAQTTIGDQAVPFGFLAGESGFTAPLTDEDGSPATQAGGHPYQLTVDLGFPTRKPNFTLIASGHLRDSIVDLPRGEIVNPNATPVLCTEKELFSEGLPGCPAASQIGTITLLTFTAGGISGYPSGLYNMVPPPGAASNFGFDAVGTGVFAHILGGVRSDGDYGLSGASYDNLALQFHPLFGIRVQFWGDPSAESHDSVRSDNCLANGGTSCVYDCVAFPKTCIHLERIPTALLTSPSRCTGQPDVSVGHAYSWEEPNVEKTASYASADIRTATPASVDGCNQMQFEPTLEAKPTTNLADSPSGLDVKVHQPTDEHYESTSPAIMKDIKLTLPEGMSVNPSSADGLGSCTEAQSGIHTKSPTECPDDSKVGTVEATTPLLDHPVSGALYVARPYQNPSGSLIALYLTVHDPITGVVANLPGKVITDPNTGQITSIFEENPELPLEDVKVHLFTGPRAALRTPPTCGAYTPKADITPWSAPETPDANVSDSFAIQATPLGGSCPTDLSQLPTSPSFEAGTIAPQAGTYSPFVLKLTRGDDTQEPQAIDTTLAPGLVGKLAGVSYCPESGIAQAIAREKPNQGALEQQSPSCPSSSEVGEVDVAAGAGITPLHVKGHAYLAGPYKGASLSLVIITPAVAGPFDLGAVVVRTALYLNSETAVIHAVSDPLPAIREGIPLDVRTIALKMGRPNFTLNPTSCDPMSITGQLTTTQGQLTALTSPFQVGGCADLPYKPKVAIKLKGATKRTGHPALTATATFRPGDANTRFVQATLPRSEFLDQAHIGTVCTRVQFAAEQCPAASVYGKAKATTPLLEKPLEGPVYLRSSSHELPDLVADLHGQVDVVLDGRVDSVNGGIRTTFEATPDAPVSKFTLEMQGAKKGLLINSANLCKLSPKQRRATLLMEAQNGKVSDSAPLLANSCKKPRRHRHGGHKKHAK